MNLRTRLSRSNGYRLMGMFDESILILEDIPFDEERWHPLVVEACTVIECTGYGTLYRRRRKKSVKCAVGTFVAAASSRRVYTTNSAPISIVSGGWKPPLRISCLRHFLRQCLNNFVGREKA